MKGALTSTSPLLAVAALAACAHVPEPLPAAPPVIPPAPVETAAPAPAPEPPPARWARVYARSCNQSITAPVLAPDGQSVSSCGARFDVERGRFLGAAPEGLFAWLPGDRALVDEHSDGGLAIVAEGAPPVRDGGGRPEAVAISPDGSRVVSLETRDGERRVVVRALPSLARVRETSLGKGPSAASVGFLADGREAVLASYPCVETACDDGADASCKQAKCSGHGMFVIDQGKIAPLVPSVRAGAFGARGDVAAIVRDDGSAALVALPDGRALAALPAQGEREIRAIAVSDAGDRAAIAWDEGVSILARSGAGFVEVLADARRHPSTLRFAADGRALFVGHELAVYREGAAPREVRHAAYDPALPAGFVPVERKGDEWHLPNEATRVAYDHEIAMFAHPKLGAEVTVAMMDPDEIDPAGDAEAWAKRVIARMLPHTSLETAADRKKAGFVAWGEPGARAFELHWVASGCEDVDSYERVSEKDGAIVRVRLLVYGALPAKRAAPWLGAFFDDPLGRSPRRAAVRERSAAKAKSAAAQRKAAQKKTARPKRKARRKG